MSHDRIEWAAAGTLMLSWAVGLLVPWWNDWELDYPAAGPRLPIVSILHSSESCPDVISIVPSLFRTALLAAGLAGVSLFVLLALGMRRRVPFYVSVSTLAYAFALSVDVLRAYANDWFVYLLSFLGVVPLHEDTYFGKGTYWETPWNWMSLPFLLLAVGSILRIYRREHTP